MTHKEPFSVVQEILESVRAGILATIGSDGYPRTRWMTATTLKGEKDFIYCVSMSGSRKVADIGQCDRVEWSFQNPELNEIVTLTGRAMIIHSPDLKAQVLESLGNNLERFWRIYPDPRKLVVIETAIESASHYSFGIKPEPKKESAP